MLNNSLYAIVQLYAIDDGLEMFSREKFRKFSSKQHFEIFLLADLFFPSHKFVVA